MFYLYQRRDKMKSVFLLILVFVVLAMITGCTPGPNELTGSADKSGDVAGFVSGLWHGFISLFTFILSFFSDNIRMYEVHNNGNWYNFGYLLGVMSFYGGSGGGAGRRSRRC
jgi:hypothetical protein